MIKLHIQRHLGVVKTLLSQYVIFIIYFILLFTHDLVVINKKEIKNGSINELKEEIIRVNFDD